MLKMKERMLSPYRTERLETRKKSWLLIRIASVLGALALVLTLTMVLTGAWIVAGLTVGLFLFCGATILLVSTGHYKPGVNSFILILFFITFSAIKFDQYVDPYETYVLAALGLFLLIIVCLVGYHSIQALIVTALNIASILTVYLLDILPAAGGEVSVLHVQNLATSLMLTSGGGFVGFLSLRLLKELVLTAETNAEETKQKFAMLDQAVGLRKEKTLIMVSGLAESSRKSVSLITDSESNLNLLEERNESLNSLIEISGNANGSVQESVKGLRQGIREYSRSVSSVSAAVEEIIQTLETISGGARSKKMRIDVITEAISRAAGSVDNVRSSIEKIGVSTRAMMEMLSLISDVAARTNLLAMNASIEAAHAGEKGRGFSVVAQEIRKLAEETAASAGNISAGMKANIDAVEHAIRTGNESASSFQSIDGEVREIAELFSEISSGVEEMVMGGQSILEDVSAIQSSSEQIDQSAEKAFDLTGHSLELIEEVARESEKISRALLLLRELSSSIRSEAGRVDSFGQENLISNEDFFRRVSTLGAAKADAEA